MRLVCLAGFVLVAGCNHDPSCAVASSMQTVQTEVFDGCTISSNGGCHAAAPFGANLDLTSGNAWQYLVHAPSNSAPGRWRVEPGDLDASFLWHKLTDELATDSSEGVPMPRDRSDVWAPLSDAKLATVRCWITTGASP
jgi:hypothetical protein